jgi:single-strand DNA-binding protein
MAPPSRESKPCPQASALRLCSPPLRFVLSALLQGWASPLGLTLATPDLAGLARVAVRNPKSHFRRNKLLMNINRVTLAGFAGKDARTSSTQNGRSMTKLSIATTKRYKDAQEQWQEKTQWHSCVAYDGPTADYAAKIQTGDHVFLEGELIYREYERTVETESSPVKVQWPVTEIVIGTISVIDRKQNREQRGAA